MANYFSELWSAVPDGYKMIQAVVVFVLAIIYVDWRHGQRKRKR